MASTLASVRQLPGISKVTGSLSSNQLVVTYDPTQLTVEQIIEAVEDLGFRVEGTFEP